METYYFMLDLNSDSEADFKEAGRQRPIRGRSRAPMIPPDAYATVLRETAVPSPSARFLAVSSSSP